MLELVDELRQEMEAEEMTSEDDVERFRIKYLGQKRGRITKMFKKIRDVAPEDRPAFGQQLNALKQETEARLEQARERLAQDRPDETVSIDLTLPGRRPFRGSVHPLTQTMNDVVRIFERFGFAVAEGPEIEDDWHNFTALNFPPDHPARDMQDTLFIEASEGGEGGVLLRTHTSPVQIRVMQEQPPPVRVVVPGRVYRNEAISYKSFCLFHQVEVLYIDEDVTFADLKYLLHAFARSLFGDDVRLRFRPSFFPFTEPSAEVDIWWENPDHPDGGQWLEILGCGMVDPNVLTAVDIDPERYTGYAAGLGIERIAMLRYGIDDIRLFYENDVRFLDQF
ncbi:MAG: phenylalanine--tRNA ligase subunit alpha [Bacteroidetes bacterium]|jgi:phenylalanyl-tRNA synthetase alpha chain|nr:phenylalanine--tRNA ligase subunit alpha [Bacteroidota bacterium]